MARIRKQGLDYFPINTDFVRDRRMRRVMKREGEGALVVVLNAIASIYEGEGYYVRADDGFYEDQADCLFRRDADDVRRILDFAAECGFFDQRLLHERGVLTSAYIQRQFLFITKRRSASLLSPELCLLSDEELDELTARRKPKATDRQTETEATDDGATDEAQPSKVEAQPSRVEIHSVQDARRAEADDPHIAAAAECATNSTQNATIKRINTEKRYFGTQSIEKHSIAKHRKENSPLLSSPTVGTPGADVASAVRQRRRVPAALLEEDLDGSTGEVDRVWTDADIDRLCPPPDGLKRNLPGLILNLRLFGIPLPEQRAIIVGSNYGLIGHPVWKGFCTLRQERNGIRRPGRYLISLL